MKLVEDIDLYEVSIVTDALITTTTNVAISTKKVCTFCGLPLRIVTRTFCDITCLRDFNNLNNLGVL